MTEQTEERVEVVYVGPVELVGNKKGERWILASSVDGKSADQLQREATLFGADKSSSVVGGVYLAYCDVEDGRLTSLGRVRWYERNLDGDVWTALRAIAKAQSERDRAEAAEKKAKAAPLADRATTELALIVAAAPVFAQESVLAALMSEVRVKARKARK